MTSSDVLDTLVGAAGSISMATALLVSHTLPFYIEAPCCIIEKTIHNIIYNISHHASRFLHHRYLHWLR
jgi:hypothetical protein